MDVSLTVNDGISPIRKVEATPKVVVTVQIMNGPNKGQRIFLRPSQWMSIGRTYYADFTMTQDPALSRVHFVVRLPANSPCEIEDLGSTNGTFVNGKKVVYSRVADGDLITVGTTILQISIDH